MTLRFSIEQPKSLADIVAERLSRAIIDGELELGQPVSEEGLASSFDVSRTPVRDALAQLHRTGLIVVRAKRGSFVFKPSAADAVELCEYRIFLETQAVKLSHARAKSATIRALRAALQTMEKVRDDDPVAYGNADSQFHQTFLDHCGNAYLHDAYGLAAGKIAALRTHLTARAAPRREVSFAEHKTMTELFETGAIDPFIALLTEHIDRTRLVYAEAFSALDAE